MMLSDGGKTENYNNHDDTKTAMMMMAVRTMTMMMTDEVCANRWQ